MSVIAKSLKRLREKSKPNFNISKRRKSNIPWLMGSIALIDALLIVISLVIVLIWGYVTINRVSRRVNNVKFPAISQLKHRLSYEKNLAMSVKTQPRGLEDLFILKRFDKMFEIAKKEHNLKYEGIYYFEKNRLDKAYTLFRRYLQNHPNDYAIRAYTAFILYKEKKYGEAIIVLNAIKSKDCNLVLDRAIVYEALKRPRIALALYKKAYKQCKNRIEKNRIEKKIIVLEYYLRNMNES